MGSTEDRYVLWNYMLAEQCLLADSCDGTVLLTVAPRTLAIALEEAGEAQQSPEDAELDFVDAVAGVYRERVLSSSKRLRALKSGSGPEVPFGVGFLALSVLAAFHMHTDDEHTGRAFYPRLAKMLGCGLVRSSPMGFDGDAFLELWEELATWLQRVYRRQLAAPDATGIRRYIAFPFAHVPLRQVDIERLPQFFDAQGYEPGARAPLERLTYDLFERSGPWRALTESGQGALQDPNRRPFVVRQVAHELERWDGCRTDSSGARTATIELWMDIRRRRAQLSLLARRPPGFPESVDGGELVFQAGHEGWYEPVPLGPDDGELLSQGARIAAHGRDGRFFLELRHAQVLPLTPSEEYTGFVSDCVLSADTECAVLCSEVVVDDVARFLETLTNARVHPRRDETLPRGWCLFTDILPSTPGHLPPPGLERLTVESSIALIPEGGLRLGRRWTWLENSPARLTVLGSHRGLSAKIDGEQVELDAGGRLGGLDLLRKPGQHVVEIGNSVRQRVQVVAGAVNPACKPWLDDTPIPVPLPSGHWAVVGLRPGETDSVIAPSEGILTRPRFSARWAVSVAAGQGATALHLHDRWEPLSAAEDGTGVAPQASRHLARSIPRWTEAIYQAGIRRPRLVCALGCGITELAAEWRALMRDARAAKRKARRRP